jgi:hypothetical protein
MDRQEVTLAGAKLTFKPLVTSPKYPNRKSA